MIAIEATILTGNRNTGIVSTVGRMVSYMALVHSTNIILNSSQDILQFLIFSCSNHGAIACPFQTVIFVKSKNVKLRGIDTKLGYNQIDSYIHSNKFGYT